MTRFCLVVGMAQAAAAVAWGVGIGALLPLGLGSLLLKSLWVPAWHLLPAVTVYVAASSFYTAATAGLRAMGMARRSLQAQLAGAALYLIFGVGGVLVAGAQGTVWGVAVSACLATVIVTIQFRLGTAEHRHASFPAEPDGMGKMSGAIGDRRLTA